MQKDLRMTVTAPKDRAFFSLFGEIETFRMLYLDVLKTKIVELKLPILPIQGLIIMRLGKDRVNIGHLHCQKYYIGSNVNYNVQKMKKLKILDSLLFSNDKRQRAVQLSKKGLEIHEQLLEAMKPIEELGHVLFGSLDSMVNVFEEVNKALSIYLSNQVHGRSQ